MALKIEYMFNGLSIINVPHHLSSMKIILTQQREFGPNIKTCFHYIIRLKAVFIIIPLENEKKQNCLLYVNKNAQRSNFECIYEVNISKIIVPFIFRISNAYHKSYLLNLKTYIVWNN